MRDGYKVLATAMTESLRLIRFIVSRGILMSVHIKAGEALQERRRVSIPPTRLSRWKTYHWRILKNMHSITEFGHFKNKISDLENDCGSAVQRGRSASSAGSLLTSIAASRSSRSQSFRHSVGNVHIHTHTHSQACTHSRTIVQTISTETQPQHH